MLMSFRKTQGNVSMGIDFWKTWFEEIAKRPYNRLSLRRFS